jgi:apolipoprotein D and lipocalin family protein
MKHTILALIAGAAAVFAGCTTTLPQGIEPVADFDLDGYLGKWYELARLDHRFERDLEQVSAKYSLREDGSIKVINRGYSTASNEWKEVEGKAYPARGADEGFLKVSFFGPLYGGYCVFELDPNGQHAFVSGSNRSYLWLLSRTPTVSEKVWRRFESRAAELGFDTNELIRVKHGE